MEYNPVHKVMLFGAGDSGDRPNRNLYRIDKEGKVTKLEPPPIHFNCTPTSKLMCDPTSGEYIVKALKEERVYAFHPIRGEWKQIPVELPAGESLAVPVDTYGVLMFLVRQGGRDFRCFLYKHKPVWPGDASNRP
jgi:hypothetical protein